MYTTEKIEKAIKDTQAALRENRQAWEKDWAKYASGILRNTASLNTKSSKFHEWVPLHTYLTTTNAYGNPNTINFDLRYHGQNVATLICNDSGTRISTKDYNQTNMHFGCEIKLDGVPWNSPAARDFRAFFRESPVRDPHAPTANEEHRIESLLLTEFAKNGLFKIYRGIQPVQIAGARFPMPTPIAAARHGVVRFVGPGGGGIDILARIGAGGRRHLCIIELKDEYIPREPPSHAIEQAVKYAVFIRELLRSKAGENWWNLFRFKSPVHTPLVLFAACAMPMPNSPNTADTSFAGDEYCIGGDDKIQLHYIYFKEKAGGNAIANIYTSLPGGLRL